MIGRLLVEEFADDPKGNIADGLRSEACKTRTPRKKILIVDDAVDLIELWSYIIDEMDCCQVLAAHDGAEAVKMAIEQKPDLILMDLAMPLMDGYEATRRILSEAELSQIPVVAVSANARTGTKNRVAEAGCREFVAKPVSPETLQAIIRKYLGTQS